MPTDMKAKESVGERIATLREEKGVTQLEMAKTLGVLRQVITHWENGTRDIKSKDMIALADYLGVSCDKLLRNVDAGHLNVHAQLRLEDRSIESLQKLVKAEVRDASAHESVLEAMNDIISSEAFREIVFHSAHFRLSYAEYKARLTEEEREAFDSSKATLETFEQAMGILLEKPPNATDANKQALANEYFIGSYFFMHMVRSKLACDRAFGALADKLLNGKPT
jgi:transcriptional regulator with XRE-family HTH domain